MMPGPGAVIFVRVDVAFWAAGPDELHERIGKRSGRAEPRRRALAYLQRLLAGLELKNGRTTTG